MRKLTAQETAACVAAVALLLLFMLTTWVFGHALAQAIEHVEGDGGIRVNIKVEVQ